MVPIARQLIFMVLNRSDWPNPKTVMAKWLFLRHNFQLAVCEFFQGMKLFWLIAEDYKEMQTVRWLAAVDAYSKFGMVHNAIFDSRISNISIIAQNKL